MVPLPLIRASTLFSSTVNIPITVCVFKWVVSLDQIVLLFPMKDAALVLSMAFDDPKMVATSGLHVVKKTSNNKKGDLQLEDRKIDTDKSSKDIPSIHGKLKITYHQGLPHRQTARACWVKFPQGPRILNCALWTRTLVRCLNCPLVVCINLGAVLNCPCNWMGCYINSPPILWVAFQHRH